MMRFRHTMARWVTRRHAGLTAQMGLFVVPLSVLLLLSGCASFTAPAAVGDLTIGAGTIPNGEYGVAYSASLTATGGNKPYTWTISAGALPTGLALSNSGAITGVPSAGGTSTFSVQVADSGQYQQTATMQYSTSIAPQLVITTSTLPSVVAYFNYTTTLTAIGGNGSYLWSLAAGSSLPAGLVLSSAGVISGKPTASGTVNFTVQVADSGNPAQTTSKALTIVVMPAPLLTITTTSLPSGPVGSNYSANLLSQGGTTPITWGLASGSVLPVGLALNAATGAISGTPTVVGSFTFKIQAADASTPQQIATQTLTLTVTPVASLVIDTSSLPIGTVGAGYSTTLSATGGVAPLSWSVPAGNLPAGLALNPSSGLISGTPSASGITAFTIEVADSETPSVKVTKQVSLTINASLGSGVNDGELAGSYVFLFNGFSNGNSAGSANGVAILGTVTADGKGDLVGSEDINTAAGLQSQLPITGQYAIGSDNRGTMIVNDGTTLATYAIAVGSISAGVAQRMNLIEFDNTSAANAAGVVGTGVARLQTPSAFAASTLKGSFVFGLQGETPCNTCALPATPYGPVVAVGILEGDGNGNLTGQEDAGAMSTSYTGVTLTGSYTNPASGNGRGTISLSATGALYPAAPTSFVYYVVSSSELMMISSSSHAITTLLSGDVQLQQQSVFSTSSPSGVMIAYEASASGGDGVTHYPSAANATLEMLTISGVGTASLSQDINNGGVFSTPGTAAVTFTVASNGRMPISLAGGSGQVLYLYNNSVAFGLDLPQAGFAPGLILVEPQASGTLPPFLSGTHTVATLPSEVSVTMAGGVSQFTANNGGLDPSSISGNGSYTLDSSTPEGTLSSGASSTIFYLEGATGRATTSLSGSTSVASILYVISPSKAVQISTGSGSTPTVLVLEH